MAKAIANRTARILIIEPSSAVRQLLGDVFRGIGFKDFATAASVKDALGMLEFEEFHWVVTPAMLDESVNALHLLKVFTEDSRTRQIRMSLIVDENDDFCLPRAFELGLFSYHRKAYVRDTMDAEFKGVMERLDFYSGNSTLTASDYLQKFLIEKKRYRPFKTFVERLLKLLPGSPDVLLKLAEAHFVVHEPGKGFATLLQIEHLFDNLKPRLEALSKRYLGPNPDSANSGTKGQNALGVKHCVIIDPDTDVQLKIKEFLAYAGVPEIVCFENGELAWDYCKAHKDVDLVIQEWRIPRVSGPQILQRMRTGGFFDVPIVVISSLIKKDETPLVREMGVSSVVAKPFDKFTFFKELVWTLQQNVCPTEQKTFEQKIRMLLKAKKNAEAESILTEYLQLSHIPDGSKKQMIAELHFAHGRYKAAKNRAVEAIKLAGDSLLMLNLLGKSFMKLGEFDSALKCMEKAQSISPHNIERLCNIAEVQFDMGMKDESKASIASASALDADSEIVIETDAGIALLSGDTQRAKNLMNQLDSLPNIISFMNNRAVALTRCGKSAEGIQLYKDTLVALPEPHAEMHDIVLYNLGLAYARSGDANNAMSQLELVKAPSESQLGRKALSLKQRLQKAKASGAPLVIKPAEPTKSPEDTDATDADNKAGDEEDLPLIAGAAGAHAGELCCYLVFKCSPEEEEQTNSYLENMPKFGLRKVIQKEGA